MATLRVLFLGDVVGSLGRAMFQKHCAQLKQQYSIDAVIVNGENAANGRGITPRMVRFLRQHGADVVTSGNHIWAKKEIYGYLAENNDLLRPANFPSSCPGTGQVIINVKGHDVAIVNLQGRVFMREHVDCPFKAADTLLTYLKHKTPIIFVDFHAETSSEKMGIAYYLDGRVSGVVGTHTHIQTADERILPKGTAYITDLGMSGALNSMIGMKKEPIIQMFLTQMPQRFEVDTQGPAILTGVWIEVDTQTGKALKIERIRILDEEIQNMEDDNEKSA